MKLCLVRRFAAVSFGCCVARFGAFGVLMIAAFAGEPAAVSASPAERIAALRAEIAHHDELYHRNATPEISDYDYDQLKLKLVALEREFPVAAQAAPTLASVGDDRTGLFAAAKHRVPMLSLEKTYSEADVRGFVARVQRQLGRTDLTFVVEPKFDGFAVSATYEKGRLVRVATRGNGAEGDDITANARQIRGLPLVLRTDSGDEAAANLEANPPRVAVVPDLVELRGEVYVSFAEFRRINAEREAAGEPVFANPRNLAAGTIRQLDPRAVAERRLEIVFYGIGACEPAHAAPASQQELHDRIRAWGLPGVRVEHLSVVCTTDALWTAIEAMNRARAGFTFPTDGAVVKVDDFAAQRELGATDAAPRWAIAYKFAPERVETQVRAITLQVGRTGVLTPVAELAPVMLGGSTIARATLHNRAELARRDVRVGDFVYLEKAGEIIPAVIGVNLARRPPNSTPFAFPENCPECGGVIEQRADQVAVRCSSRTCPAQLRRRVEHFASKEGVDIKGLGPVTIDALVAGGRIKSIADVYRLRRDDLLALDHGGEKAADQLLASIDASKRAELWRVISGLGIPRIGVAGAKELARRCDSLDGLMKLPSVSDAMDSPAMRALREFCAVEENRSALTELMAVGVRPQATVRRTTLAGKIFVLTGTLPSLSRSEASARIETAGGVVASAVSRKTSYVVAGENPGAKLQDAKRLGILVINEGELTRLLRESAAEDEP